MTTDIILTVLMFSLVGLSVVLIPWVGFLIARALIRQARRRAILNG